MKYVGYTAVFFIVITINALMHGYALSVLWQWFIVPVFGVGSITIPLAIGLSLAGGFLSNTGNSKGSEGRKSSDIMLEAFTMSFAKSFGSIAIGWVVLRFI